MSDDDQSGWRRAVRVNFKKTSSDKIVYSLLIFVQSEKKAHPMIFKRLV